MIKPEMIPHGLALIARKAWAEGAGPTNDDDWNAAIAAALNAWPGMQTGSDDGGMTLSGVYLPIAQKQEDGDE